MATRFLFGKLFCVTTLFGFGEKRCRKNLPLGDHSKIIREFYIQIRSAVGMLLFIPALLGLAIVYPVFGYFTFRRLISRPCDNCAKPFGRAEIERAREDSFIPTSATVAEDLARGAPPRNRSYWSVVCPNCGAEYRYSPQNGKWERD